MTRPPPSTALVRTDLRLSAAGLDLEAYTLGALHPGRTTLVFLHEGLGCAALWRDFPQRLCEALGAPGLIYSRAGYGHSSPARLPRQPDFMHHEADEVLPAVMAAAGVGRAILFGHSDGASIALLHAARESGSIAAAIVMAPHLFVETITVDAIRDIDRRFETGSLPSKLARHHRDASATFHGWADIWLHPDFLAWNIEAEVSRITCPVLALQGLQDEYGTMDQLHRLAALTPRTSWIGLDDCGHHPFRDQPDRIIDACRDFVAEDDLLAARKDGRD